MIRRPLFRVFALACAAVASHTYARSQAAHPLPTCPSNQLSLATDDENGNFNGMSHSGTLVVVRNLGPAACQLQPTPQLAFLGANKQPINITTTLDTPFNKGPVVNGQRLPMGHGPVVLPINLAAGAEATASLRWVSGDVYDHGTCVQPASLQLKLATGAQLTPFHGQICGPDPSHLTITATRLALDPVYTPPR